MTGRGTKVSDQQTTDEEQASSKRRPVRIKCDIDTMSAQRKVIRKWIDQNRDVDFSALTPTGKQAALSLRESGEVEIVEVEGAPRVAKKTTSNPLHSFWSAGAWS